MFGQPYSLRSILTITYYINMKLKLKKEYAQCYSFEFKGQKYTVEVMHIEDPYNNFKVDKGWQILESDNFPILDGLSKTRKEALNTFLLHNA